MFLLNISAHFNLFVPVLVLLVIIGCSITDSKIFERCELAKLLLNTYKLPKSQIATWVCLAFKESSYNTAAQNKVSGDYGLFQINSKYWCSTGSTAKDCGVTCDSLLDNDISNDVKCAKLIQSKQGFSAWVAYQYCKNPDSYIANCGI